MNAREVMAVRTRSDFGWKRYWDLLTMHSSEDITKPDAHLNDVLKDAPSGLHHITNSAKIFNGMEMNGAKR